jgi:hypothetical protein
MPGDRPFSSIPSHQTLARLGSAALLSRFGPELIFLIFEQHIESGHGAVALGNVLLHVEFLSIAQLRMRINLLLQDTQIVPHHHDFVLEKNASILTIEL